MFLCRSMATCVHACVRAMLLHMYSLGLAMGDGEIEVDACHEHVAFQADLMHGRRWQRNGQRHHAEQRRLILARVRESVLRSQAAQHQHDLNGNGMGWGGWRRVDANIVAVSCGLAKIVMLFGTRMPCLGASSCAFNALSRMQIIRY